MFKYKFKEMIKNFSLFLHPKFNYYYLDFCPHSAIILLYLKYFHYAIIVAILHC
jgi:hypothetical protein